MTFNAFIESTSSMVTRDTPYPTIDTFSNAMVKKKFPVPPLGWYLFGIVNGSMYPPRFINANVLCISTIGNEFVAVVTIAFLDFVMSHRIR